MILRMWHGLEEAKWDESATPSNNMSSGRTNPEGPQSNHEPPRAICRTPMPPKTALPCLNHPWNPYPELSEAPPGGPLPSRNGEDSSSSHLGLDLINHKRRLLSLRIMSILPTCDLGWSAPPASIQQLSLTNV